MTSIDETMAMIAAARLIDFANTATKAGGFVFSEQEVREILSSVGDEIQKRRRETIDERELTMALDMVADELDGLDS